jgi:signal transduction histidine kinase/ligand-binding sensor domain-containing protein
MSKWRHHVVAGTVLSTVAFIHTPSAFALDPRLDVAQYAHTSWKISDGFVRSGINAIAQTPDGYLWLGTDAGLVRFDGIKAVPWQSPRNASLPSEQISSLLVARDGTLWIGTTRGIASWKEGRLTRHQGPNEAYSAGRLLEDRDGTIWATIFLLQINRWVLCAFQLDHAECHGKDGGAGSGALGLYEDRKENLWVGTPEGLWRWKPAPAQFYPLEPETNGLQGLAEDEKGGLLISRRGRVERFVDGRTEIRYPLPAAAAQLQFLRALSDRDGSLWLGSSSAGLLHVHQGILNAFKQSDGLSSDSVGPIFEDHEGNVWVGTTEGLDRFREVAIASVSTRQGLSNPRANGLLATPDGSVWIATYEGLNKTTGDEVIVYRARSEPGGPQGASRASHTTRYVTSATLPIAGVYSIFQDRPGRVWLSTESAVGYLENDRVVTMNRLAPLDVPRSITEDGEGTIWIAHQKRGLFRLSRGGANDQPVPWTALNHEDPASVVVGDPRQGGAWVGFGQGGLSYFADGRVRASYGTNDGLARGAVSALYFDREGALWIAADGGLSRLKSGRLSTLTSANGLPCESVQWAIHDDAGALWLAMTCGLVRIPAAAIRRWTAAADQGQATNQEVQLSVFGNADGFRSAAGFHYYTAPVVKSTDGRLWFLGQSGVSVLDPARLPFNSVPPPVHIEQIIADRKTYDTTSASAEALRLPRLTRDLQIEYTGLSFVDANKVSFRYKLEGFDRDWQDVGTRRQAYYNNLRPGSYRFRVIAANNSGVWNETGATLAFTIAPAYYQTPWFLALSVASVIALVWTAHRVRLRIVERHQVEISALNERMMKAQEQERIRIAGELHDGVMQDMLAATMMLGTAKRRLPSDSNAVAAIDKVQQKLIQAGTDIRQLSHDLHPPLLQEAGLPRAVCGYCEQFSAACGIPVSCDADEHVGYLSRGASLALFRILQEALGNAAKHAAATHITVRLTRADGAVTLAVSDDGVGLDRARLASAGGLGLVMMRERASQLNGRFEIDTAPGSGSTIRVTIPFR